MDKNKLKYRDEISPFINEIERYLKPNEYNLIYDYFFENHSLKHIANLESVTYEAIRQRIIRIKPKIEMAICEICIDKNIITEYSKIDQLFFSTRVKNILKKHDIHTIKEFRNYTLKDIYLFRNMGKLGIENLIKTVKERGLNPYTIFKEMDNYMIEYPQRIDLKELIEKDGID